jgi:hypothetical protein
MSCCKGKVYINFRTHERIGMSSCMKVKITVTYVTVFENIVCVSCSAYFIGGIFTKAWNQIQNSY